MNSGAQVSSIANRREDGATSVDDSYGKSIQSTMLPMVAALFATAVSIVIAGYGGWQRGGTQIEQVLNVALAGIAVVFLHLLPMCWNMFRLPSRVFAFALWSVSLFVILYGQATFFVLSQQHAGEQRSATLPAIVSSLPPLPNGRSLTAVAQDIARTTAALAGVNPRRCEGNCPSPKALRMTLLARLDALSVEADEAKRREADEDRRNRQFDRDEALRSTLREDQAASTVASWLGTTERRLELISATACAVVLEGAAIVSWLLVSNASCRARTREAVPFVGKATAAEREAALSEHEAIARAPHLANSVHLAHADNGAAVTRGRPEVTRESADSPARCEDEHLLTKIRAAVATGQLKPTQASIRKFLRCGQPKAARLNRQYSARFGDASD
ncbi:hypothetical protein PPGU16_01310 [Paraburkholderia largidicola]|uniref:Uncharacterized protein n=2 Tax=Paraburkholderia largidicola TaxID=3014751 RepID=A0A7I8BEQ0_9BURK|nr:hypothetical protein PPGU16_01310 [Paraburkholderia sp. PGU16]